ncbi:out at first protein-like [Plakobranchus ocellatus]|uniref:Out at first protein-like n=1 Tax=Plakobranchus ocellatus TaxID=259542 RepID=A0AAV4CCC9_9GAST|nr:out at first protein-like [Plakobranchus ocellatus]
MTVRFIFSALIPVVMDVIVGMKNPTAIRSPEEERETTIYSLDLLVNLEKALVISPHIYNLCKEAKDGVFTQESDLKTISKSLDKDYNTLISATSDLSPNKYSHCHDLKGPGSLSQLCVCQIHTCVMWYPCGLKYCQGSDNFGRLVSYRCGIKTCKRCLAFNYVAASKMKCLWDF